MSSVLFFSRPRSKGWPHHGCTFSIYLCPLSFWLTLPQGVLSTSWCCPSRPCVAFLTCVHLALFLALSLSPGNFLVSSWCDQSMLASLLWVFTLALLRIHSLFSLLSLKPADSFSVLSSKRLQDVFLHSSWESSFHSRMLLQAKLVLLLVISSLKSVCCDFHIFCSDAPIACLVLISVVHSPSSVIGDPRYSCHCFR